jgi:predicted PurR-regulated permease PerM/CheY-like chemotaxis protein
MVNPAVLRQAKLLIVDNQEVNVALLEQMLRGAGYASIASTLDPREVCALHRVHRYDLILLDLQMPGLDGFQVMAGLREIEGDRDLPVLVLTAQAELRARALRAGAQDFLSKPFELGEVLLRVRSLLALRLLTTEAAPRGEAAASSAAGPAAAPPPVASPPAAGVPASPAAAPSPGSVPRTLGWILAALAAVWLVYRLWAIGVLVGVALLLAGALHPLVVGLEARGFKRRTALLVVIAALIVGGGLLTFLMVPPLIDEYAKIIRDLPGQRERLIAEFSRHRFTVPVGQAVANLRLEQGEGRLKTFLIGHSSGAVAAVGYVLTAFFLSLYFLADGKRTQGALYALVRRSHHMRLARIIHNLRTIVGGYVRGQIITSLAFGTFTGVLLLVCGVRNAVALSLLAALLDVVPTAGGLLAAAPAFLTALGQGPRTAVTVLVSMVVYQLFEIKVLAPAVYGHALRLSPVIVTLALIAGGILFGVMGALFALPIAAALQMMLKELGVELPGDDRDDPTARSRDRKTEAAYELMSAGASAGDAGQIAADLAHGVREADAWVAASKAKKKQAGLSPDSA